MKTFNFQTEPAVIIAAIVVILEAAIGGLILFTDAVSADQAAFLIGFVGVVGTALGGIFTRGQVYSPASVAKIKEAKAEHSG